MSDLKELSMSFDELLDGSIDDLADIPAFAVYPSGVHTVRILSFERKEITNAKKEKHDAVEMKMKHLAVVELANATDVPPAEGTETNVLFMLDNEFGQGNLKNVLTALAGMLGTSKLGETMEAAKGAEVNVLVQIKPDKNDKDVMRMNIKKVIV